MKCFVNKTSQSWKKVLRDWDGRWYCSGLLGEIPSTKGNLKRGYRFGNLFVLILVSQERFICFFYCL